MTVIIDRDRIDFANEDERYRCPSCNHIFHGNGVNGKCANCGAPMEDD
jgi:rubrerythrin